MTDTLPESPQAEPTPAEAALAEVTTKVVAEIKSGTMTMADLLKALSPAQTSEEVPAVIPTAKEITAEQRAAMDRVTEVYGRVVPTERRTLVPTEAEALVEEKETLDKVKKMAEERLEDIKATVHNHFDVEVEEALGEDEQPPLRDGHGHYITEGRVGGPGQAKEFAREVKNYAASLDHDALKAAVDLGLMEHKDYLAMTRQVRVVDEGRVMEALGKNPALIHAIKHATKPGKQGTAVALRKRK